MRRAGPSGLDLLAGGGALTVVDASTGSRTAVDGVSLPPGGAVTQLTLVPAGALAVVQPDQAGGDTGPGWVYLVRPGRAPLRLVRADEVMAGARPDRFWGFVYPRQQGSEGTLSEVTTEGRLLSERKVPASWQPLADTGSGLLVGVYRQTGGGQLVIIDPVSLQVDRSLGEVSYVAGASPTMAAWTEPGQGGCGVSCDLVVGSTRGAQRRTFRLTLDSGLGSAVFSPDGRRLALAYFGRHGGEGTATPGFVEVLDLATGRRTRVPGVATPQKQAAEVTWSRDGRWLGIAVRWRSEGYERLAVWPVSGGPVVELPGRLPARDSSPLLAVPPPFAP